MTKTHRIAIVGGGITGLTAARQLLKDAQKANKTVDITLYEADNRLGGKVISYRDGGLTLEGGPDSMLARKPAGVRLLQALGLESEIVNSNPLSMQTYIVNGGRLEPMPQGTYMGVPRDLSVFLNNQVLSAQGKLRSLFDLVQPAMNLSEDVSLGKFLRARLGDEWVEKLAEPLLAGIYAGTIDELSLQSTWPVFGELASAHRSLIIGARSLAKQQQPANPSGRSAFITVRGGLMTIIERLADDITDGVKIALRHRISSMEKSSAGYQLTIEHDGQTQVEEFDSVVIATPVKQMKELLMTHLPKTSQTFDVPYVSTATVIVGYPSSHVNVDLSRASGFLVPRPEKRAITASTWVSSKWPHATNEDFVILRCYVGRRGQTEYLNLSDQDMVKEVHREVQSLVGIQTSPAFHKVTRWDEAMPNYPIGHKVQYERLLSDIKETLPGVFIAGGGYRGLGLPDCIEQGESAASAVQAFLQDKLQAATQ